MARHAQPVPGRERLLSGQVREPFGAERNGIERSNGKSQRWPAASDDVGDVREHGAETHVLPTQNIPLADATASQGGEVSRGHVVDVREIEARIHKSRHAAARAFDDEDRKSTRLNSSHLGISYAVFCLKKKTMITIRTK